MGFSHGSPNTPLEAITSQDAWSWQASRTIDTDSGEWHAWSEVDTCGHVESSCWRPYEAPMMSMVPTAQARFTDSASPRTRKVSSYKTPRLIC